MWLTSRGTDNGPLTRPTVNRLVSRAGEGAEIPIPVTPHQLRHACGLALANRGVPIRALQHWLGHSSIRHTLRYTALPSAAVDGIWR
ncbi:tyrosine-type recombinase/integrase [Lentisalinibacter orientalis]